MSYDVHVYAIVAEHGKVLAAKIFICVWIQTSWSVIASNNILAGSLSYCDYKRLYQIDIKLNTRCRHDCMSHSSAKYYRL